MFVLLLDSLWSHHFWKSVNLVRCAVLVTHAGHEMAKWPTVWILFFFLQIITKRRAHPYVCERNVSEHDAHGARVLVSVHWIEWNTIYSHSHMDHLIGEFWIRHSNLTLSGSLLISVRVLQMLLLAGCTLRRGDFEYFQFFFSPQCSSSSNQIWILKSHKRHATDCVCGRCVFR